MVSVTAPENPVFEKTARGREEIATRRYGLAPRLRSLLVLVDGKSRKSELLSKFSFLGLNEESLGELLDSRLIIPVEIREPSPATAQQQENLVKAPAPADEHAENKPAAPSPAEKDVERILALKRFFNETVKATLGLRGFSIQLKVERANSFEDFRNLRNIYLEAVLKARGPEMARSLRTRLDQLLL